MAILVEKSPNKIYQSIVDSGLTEEERQKADALDGLLEKKISEYLHNKTAESIKAVVYWELGSVLREIAENSGLLNMEELPLFWKNAKMYLPDELLYKDRGPNREHLWYCYRLSTYDRIVVDRMNWSEWVTLFDSPAVNREQRFDQWFNSKLLKSVGKIKREQIRTFIPFLNTISDKIDMQALLSSELINCFNSGWETMTAFIANDISSKKMRSLILKHLFDLEDVMSGLLSPTDYAKGLIKQANQA